MKVRVLSPSKAFAQTEATSVLIPTAIGYQEILDRHVGLIAELGVGELKIKGAPGGSDLSFFIAKGYLQVHENEVVILADVVELPKDINLARATEALKRAEERLSVKDMKIDIARALYAKDKAAQRLKLGTAAK